MKVVNFGSCNIDYVYSLDHIVGEGETQSTYSMEIFPGGKGLNQSIAMARAGLKIYHAGCIGQDGDLLLDVMKDSNVDTSYVIKNNLKNGHAIIQVASNGENCIFLYQGSNWSFTTDYIDRVLADMSSGDILVLQNEINYVDYIIEQAHKKRLNIVLNPSPYNESISKIDLNKISYLLLNEVEAKGYTGCSECSESLKFFKENYPSLKVVMTLGGQGCVYLDNEQEIYQPAFCVDVVDTTAAGDTFTGYFVSGIAECIEMSKVLRKASVASALCVSRKGAAPSIPCENEVEVALKKLKAYIRQNA